MPSIFIALQSVGLKINPDEDWVVVNPLSEVVKELAGFELEDGLEPADHAE